VGVYLHAYVSVLSITIRELVINYNTVEWYMVVLIPLTVLAGVKVHVVSFSSLSKDWLKMYPFPTIFATISIILK
jgi:hypothetical protein